VQLADSLASAEEIMMVICNQVLGFVVSGRLNAGDVASQVDARHISALMEEIIEQIHAVRSGDADYAETYLADQRILKLYNTAAAIVPQISEWEKMDDGAPEFKKWCRDGPEKLAAFVRQVWRDMQHAAVQGAIDPEMEIALRRKWEIYEKILNPILLQRQDPRTVQPWCVHTEEAPGLLNTDLRTSR
jgi:hypothetical protein